MVNAAKLILNRMLSISPKYIERPQMSSPTAGEPGIPPHLLLDFTYELIHQMNLMLNEATSSELEHHPLEVGMNIK